jgi:predicted phage tail protein
LLTKIKIHSAFTHLFSECELIADLKTYDDIPRYLGSMHPRFARFVKRIYNEQTQDGYLILNKNLQAITDQELFIKRIKEEEQFYVVPAIYGGGGKSMKTLFTVAAIAATGYIGFTALTAATAATTTGAAVGSAAVGAAGATGGTAAAAAGLGSFGTTLAVNAGLALVTSLFTQKPESLTSRDQQVRQNNMFGSLQNTIDSGTSIPLLYGQHRVAGQFISGYIDSIDHGKNDDITVLEQFEDE